MKNRDTYTVGTEHDPRWASGVSEALAAKLARVAVRKRKRGVNVTRDRDGARMSLVPDGSGLGYNLLSPAEAARA